MSNADFCDCCGKSSGALIPNAADDGDTRACPECVKVLVLCPRCNRVANWTQSGDLWMCNAEGCGSEHGTQR